jgi:hypothetical protein
MDKLGYLTKYHYDDRARSIKLIRFQVNTALPFNLNLNKKSEELNELLKLQLFNNAVFITVFNPFKLSFRSNCFGDKS